MHATGWIAASLAASSPLPVRDESVGLPDGFDPAKSKSLGMRIIANFVKQLRADFTIKPPRSRD